MPNADVVTQGWGTGQRLVTQGYFAPSPVPPPVDQVSGGGLPITLSEWWEEKQRKREAARRHVEVRCEPGELRIVGSASQALAITPHHPAATGSAVATGTVGLVRWWDLEKQLRTMRREAEERWLLEVD